MKSWKGSFNSRKTNFQENLIESISCRIEKPQIRVFSSLQQFPIQFFGFWPWNRHCTKGPNERVHVWDRFERRIATSLSYVVRICTHTRLKAVEEETKPKLFVQFSFSISHAFSLALTCMSPRMRTMSTHTTTFVTCARGPQTKVFSFWSATRVEEQRVVESTQISGRKVFFVHIEWVSAGEETTERKGWGASFLSFQRSTIANVVCPYIYIQRDLRERNEQQTQRFRRCNRLRTWPSMNVVVVSREISVFERQSKKQRNVN